LERSIVQLAPDPLALFLACGDHAPRVALKAPLPLVALGDVVEHRLAMAPTRGVHELAGAIGGLGIRGIGFAVGGGGLIPASLGVGIAISMAIATICCAVAIMFVRDARPLAAIIVFASLVATIAGGPFAAIGGLFGLGAAGLAFRLDRTASLA
jgi:hypothetical protein